MITHDTDVKDPDSLYATALPMVELVNVVRSRVKSRRAVVILDTCHSGGALAPGARGFRVSGVNPSAAADDTLNGLRQGEGRAIIASSRVDESSYESATLRNGYFTFCLIQGTDARPRARPDQQALCQSCLSLSTGFPLPVQILLVSRFPFIASAVIQSETLD